MRSHLRANKKTLNHGWTAAQGLVLRLLALAAGAPLISLVRLLSS
jgi:hypothetical protein